MHGHLEGGRVGLGELHRFPSAVVRVGGTMRWDVLRIFEELKAGMRVAAERKLPVVSMSTDSWGVDYVWLREGEPVVSTPFHYRDPRTDDGFRRVFAKIPEEEIFERTGIQFMTLNTLYQLNDDAECRPWVFDAADGFLNIADHMNHLFSGVRKAEESLASTTQLYDPRSRGWAFDLAGKIGVPERLFPAVVPSGTVLGPLLDAVREETGLGALDVVAACSHDTGAAVAAVPASGDGWAYLSSGTWSLLGVESAEPVITARSRELNFTNESGYGGTTRFLKNISGLWIVQECRRTWAARGEDLDYATLTAMAAEAPALRSLIVPTAAEFSKPGDMPARIADFCRRTGQPVPSTPGGITRCALESLALVYKKTLDELEEVTGKAIDRIHIVGGGCKNTLLNQCAADATGRKVLAGPVEATALGNILIQALALGRLGSLAELREVVRNSFPLEEYTPSAPDKWRAAHARFAELAAA
jgi:rhamnulokinase